MLTIPGVVSPDLSVPSLLLLQELKLLIHGSLDTLEKMIIFLSQESKLIVQIRSFSLDGLLDGKLRKMLLHTLQLSTQMNVRQNLNQLFSM